MLVIFASQHDPAGPALAGRWAGHGAAVLTPRDLSRAGWRHDLRRPQAGTAVIAGQRVDVGEIEGVLIRWPAVFEQELHHILPAERTYVAAEMTAFLRSWFTQLPCPILNRPSAGSLLGPPWRRERWVHAAAHLRIPVHPVRRRASLEPDSPAPAELRDSVAVTVVGARWFGDAHRELGAAAIRLARSAGVGLLGVQFSAADSGSLLQSADPLPDLDRDDVLDAVLEYLLATSGAAPLR